MRMTRTCAERLYETSTHRDTVRRGVEMEFGILGPLRVVRGDGDIALGSPAQRRFLAILLTRPNQPTPIDHLVEALWGDDPPPSAHHLVHVYASRLRGLLDGDGARLTRAGGGYVLRAAPDEIDAERFMAAAREGRALVDEDPDEAARTLDEALRLWRGTPFADLAASPPCVQELAEHLERRHSDARDAWVEANLRLGRHRDLVAELDRLVQERAYDEPLSGQLMLALYRCGRQADALAVGRDLRRRLRDELGIDPSPAATDLYRRILLQDPGLLLEPHEPPGNLPRALTSFVGRVTDTEAVLRLLADTRLLTLTGPGGIGKTRLALEVARRDRTRFPDGAWWIDLATVADPAVVADLVASTLGVAVPPGADPAAAISVSLGRRNLLLLLDNCEHVVSGVGPLVATILGETSGPRLLATSRVPLRVDGEHLWPVPALGIPNEGADLAALADSEAVRLFVDRASAADPGFNLDAKGARAVAELCRRLDGLALAIEMAAARLPVLTPEEILQHLDERFVILELAAAGRLTRYRTMEAAIDASYVLLDDRERAAFDRLAVFAGPFDLEAAAAVGIGDPTVTGAGLSVLGGLGRASMVATERADEQTRYRLLETLRAYGLTRLRERGEEDRTRRIHAVHYLGLAEHADTTLGTPAFGESETRLTEAWAEIAQALDWALGHQEAGIALRGAPALAERWIHRGEAREAGRWSARLLDAASDGAPARMLAGVHVAAAFAATLDGDFSSATRHTDEATRLARSAGDHHGVILGLHMRAHVAFGTGDLAAMETFAREALAECDRGGSRWDRAGPLTSLGYVSLFGGAPDEASGWFEQGAALYRELGDRGGLVLNALAPWAEAELRRGDPMAAERLTGEAMDVGRGTAWEAAATIQHAIVLHAVGDDEAGEAAALRGLQVATDAGLEQWFRMAIRELARASVALGRPERAAQLLAASRVHMPAAALEPAIYGPAEASCCEALGEARYRELAARGAGMRHDELVALARAD